MLSRIFILVMMFFIALSLGSALALLLRKNGQDTGMAKALTIRVALSLCLFIVLMVGFYFGWIPRPPGR